jgi:ketosteroid isomerase-like protein
MRSLTPWVLIAAGSFVLGGCASSRAHVDDDNLASSPQAAHEMYVNAINSNELDRVLWMLAPDIEMLPPNHPRLIGMGAVRPWAREYLEAYVIHWEKTTSEVVAGEDWAYELYTYRSKETPRAGGQPIFDSGKGINVFRRCEDGGWRVARDIWNSDEAEAEGK